MSRKSDAGWRGKIAIVPALYLGFACYLGYHTVEGDRGLIAWLTLTDQIDTLEQQIAEKRADRLNLERRVAHLRRESLDLDLLEERARVVLNLGHPDDRIILESTPDE